ncbi:MAG: DUF2971 domain-containing protein [Candidatus Saccharibacteria bacterium]|nr:DUF2971 domain-containing protein [Rhodoferax sp.]
MPILKHNKLEQFYKYVTPETALKIIEGRRLRWSSPVLFNDPFDHQSGSAWDFSGEEFYAELARCIEYAVYDEQNYKPAEQTSMTSLIGVMRERRQPRERYREFAATDMATISSSIFQTGAAKLDEEITRILLDSKVLSLSAFHDNVVMWSHYAQSHQGAVFKLRRLEHLDHRFLVAQPVEYTDVPARYASLKEYTRHLVGLGSFDPAPRIWQLAYRKHIDWSYENEWRVHVPLMGIGHEPWYYDEVEAKELFEAIYLGCRASDDFVHAVLTTRNVHLPEMEIYRAVTIGLTMQLRFRKID